MRRLVLGAAALLLSGAAPVPASWSPQELAVLRTLWIGGLEKPEDPSNRHADDPRAARLGVELFFDRRFSANGEVACASCHDPAHGFTDLRQVGRGVGVGSRRTMPIRPAAYSTWQFWDGRADSLWAQALGPVENPVEHGFTRTEVVRVLSDHYRAPFEALFGPLPNLTDKRRFPKRASPLGDARARAAWAGMRREDRAAVDRAFANFGKAIAAYERTLDVTPTKFDDYLADLFGDGGRLHLSADEAAGLRLFIGKGGCLQCHNGPLLTNESFANTGVPRGVANDMGRAEGVKAALDDPFNCKGEFSDAGPGECEELDFVAQDEAAQTRAYKVPSLRGVGQRAPYMHAGQFKSLEEVVDHYDRAPAAPAGRSEIRPLSFSSDERRQLVAFLRTLNDR